MQTLLLVVPRFCLIESMDVLCMAGSLEENRDLTVVKTAPSSKNAPVGVVIAHRTLWLPILYCVPFMGCSRLCLEGFLEPPFYTIR